MIKLHLFILFVRLWLPLMFERNLSSGIGSRVFDGCFWGLFGKDLEIWPKDRK
jgi:hypothetical protein